MLAVQRQPITADLRLWITHQLALGHGREFLVDAMVGSGWAKETALEAIELVTSDGAPPTRREIAPARVPEPPLEGSPLYIDVGDRKVAVLQTSMHPRVVVFGGVLSDEECEQLIDLARPRMSRSQTVNMQTGGEVVHEARTSSGMFFQRGENDLVRRIEARITRLVAWPWENGEGLQILHYTPGAEYKPHYDYFDPKEPGTPTVIKRGGQRVATLVMYLGEPERGGATVFPDAQLEVAPKRGNAVFFSYPTPDPSTKTLHGGAPVLAGEKWIATKWLRERAFN
jgi:prolyl 4-hydroxylase